MLFHLISKLYETTNVIITANLEFGAWVPVFGDAKMVNTLLDRVTHYCSIIETGTTSSATGIPKPLSRPSLTPYPAHS